MVTDQGYLVLRMFAEFEHILPFFQAGMDHTSDSQVGNNLYVMG